MEFDISKFEGKMKKCVDNLAEEYGAIRAGRANPAILKKIRVDYYGSPTAIEQMAAVSVPEARVLVINPWDASALPLIEKALQQSDIGINPVSDRGVLRLNFPPLTQESREVVVKDVHKFRENAKVSIRNIRRDALDNIKTLKKDGVLTEDEAKLKEKDVQKLVDIYTEKIVILAQKKEEEVKKV